MERIARLRLPDAKRNYRFALTPLADAMFQLLIFFMLSTSLTPFSLLTVQSAPGSAGETPASGNPEAAPADLAAAGSPGDVAIWVIDADAVIVGGQRFGFDALDDLARALGTAEAPAEVILVTRPGARVQDLTTVLARLKAASVDRVQLSSGVAG